MHMTTQRFTISGMHCQACTKLTTKRLAKIQGVTNVSVDLDSKTATLTAGRRINNTEINDILADSEYRAEEVRDEDN
jgi:copper chaperone CopZ